MLYNNVRDLRSCFCNSFTFSYLSDLFKTRLRLNFEYKCFVFVVALWRRLVNLSVIFTVLFFNIVCISRSVIFQWSVESLTPVDTCNVVAFVTARFSSAVQVRDLGSSDHHSCVSSLYIPVILECKDAIECLACQRKTKRTKRERQWVISRAFEKLTPTLSVIFVTDRFAHQLSCPSK